MRDRGDFALDSLLSIEPRTCASMAKSLLRALPTPSWVCRCWNGADAGGAVARRGLLGAFRSSLLLEATERCETGPNRIKELVPAGTRISHKPGLIANLPDPAIGAPLVTSDVGLITLPAQQGRVAVAIAIVNSPLTRARQDRVIANLARRIYDHFPTSVTVRKPGAILFS